MLGESTRQPWLPEPLRPGLASPVLCWERSCFSDHSFRFYGNSLGSVLLLGTGVIYLVTVTTAYLTRSHSISDKKGLFWLTL